MSPPRTTALPVGWRSAIALLAATVFGILAFAWPFVVSPDSLAADHADDAPWVFALMLPVIIAVVFADLADNGWEAKTVAMLAVLTAVATAVRPLGAGVAGLEPMFVVLLLGGRALGPGFGFALGTLSMFTSALLTAGVGPWLPFQMLAGGWFALGAGLLPPLRGRAEIAMLIGYGAVGSLLYGLVMNLSFWPWALGGDSQLSFVAGAPVSENVARWLAFSLATSLGWDVPRAVLTGLLTLLAGPPLLAALRRATRRAAFDAPVRFTPAATGGGDHRTER